MRRRASPDRARPDRPLLRHSIPIEDFAMIRTAIPASAGARITPVAAGARITPTSVGARVAPKG
jgi:hypothetical protein